MWGALLFTSGSRVHRVRAARRARARQLTEPGDGGTDSAPDWSPDGRSVVFGRYPYLGNGWEIHILRLGAQASERLTAGRDPTWSRRSVIAFVRDEGTAGAVYTIGADGSGLRRIASGHSPDWSPDGERIVFVTARNHIATIGAEGGACSS